MQTVDEAGLWARAVEAVRRLDEATAGRRDFAHGLERFLGAFCRTYAPAAGTASLPFE